MTIKIVSIILAFIAFVVVVLLMIGGFVWLVNAVAALSSTALFLLMITLLFIPFLAAVFLSVGGTELAEKIERFLKEKFPS